MNSLVKITIIIYIVLLLSVVLNLYIARSLEKSKEGEGGRLPSYIKEFYVYSYGAMNDTRA